MILDTGFKSWAHNLFLFSSLCPCVGVTHGTIVHISLCTWVFKPTTTEQCIKVSRDNDDDEMDSKQGVASKIQLPHTLGNT